MSDRLGTCSHGQSNDSNLRRERWEESVSRLAMSDGCFPGHSCVDGGGVTSGGFSDDLRICRNIWPLWMADSNGSTLPSASSRSLAIDALDACMVKGGGFQGHFHAFRWLKALWFRRLEG